MRRLLPALSILALAGCVALTCFHLFRTPDREALDAPVETGQEAGTPVPAGDLGTATTDPERGPSRTESPSKQPLRNPGRRALPVPGVLRVGVFDGAHGHPLAGATVRFLGHQRFAELTTDESGMVECRLTPDRYRIGIQLEAYERPQIETMEVTSGAELDAPKVFLWKGSSRIEGQLAGRNVRLDQPYLVELRGVGRSPCPECRPAEENTSPAAATVSEADAATPPAPRTLVPASTCRRCGYDAEVSSWEVWPGGRFTFENLTSGPYRILARRDPEAAPDAEELIEIEPATSHQVDLVARESVAVEFELRHEDGNWFDGNWWEEAEPGPDSPAPELRSATIQYRFFAHQRRIAVARTVPADRAQPGSAGRQSISFSLSGFSLGTDQADRADRPAKEEDQLWPDRSIAGAPTARLTVERLADARHRILRVPCCRLEVEVRCGPWRSERIPLDLELGPPQPVLVTLRQGTGGQPVTAVIQGGGTLQLEGVTLENLQFTLPGSEDG